MVKFWLFSLVIVLSGCDVAFAPPAPITRTVQVWLGDSLGQMQSILGDDLTRDCDDTMCWYNFTKPSKSGNVLKLILGGTAGF